MWRVAIALVSALAVTAAHAQGTRSEQSRAPAVSNANETRPFLFDGRMKGDGSRRAPIDDYRSTSGAMVMPKMSKPAPE